MFLVDFDPLNYILFSDHIARRNYATRKACGLASGYYPALAIFRQAIRRTEGYLRVLIVSHVIPCDCTLIKTV